MGFLGKMAANISLDLSCLFMSCPRHTCDSAAQFSSSSNILFLSEVFLTERSPNLGFDFPSRLAFLCTCHAVRGKSLQPNCEMMSQIHKTLTSSFQLYLLFIIHISFSFERTCTPVCTLTHAGVSFVVVCLASACSRGTRILGLLQPPTTVISRM